MPAALCGDRYQSSFWRAAAPPTLLAYRSAQRPAGISVMVDVFEARDICKSFGPVRALSGVSVGIAAGEVHAIIGENGAAKSTFMSIFTGKFAPSSGSLFRRGTPIVFCSPGDPRKAGISIAPQEVKVVPRLSVAENIVLRAFDGGTSLVDWPTSRRRTASRDRRQHRPSDTDRAVEQGAAATRADCPRDGERSRDPYFR